MFKVVLEKLDEEVEKNLPEAVRIIRAFYFKRLEGEKDGEEKRTEDA